MQELRNVSCFLHISPDGGYYTASINKQKKVTIYRQEIICLPARIERQQARAISAAAQPRTSFRRNSTLAVCAIPARLTNSLSRALVWEGTSRPGNSGARNNCCRISGVRRPTVVLSTDRIRWLIADCAHPSGHFFSTPVLMKSSVGARKVRQYLIPYYRV